MTFDFDIVNIPFLDGDVPRSTSYGVDISQLIRFARVSSHVVDFNARNKSLTAKLLQQGYRYHKLWKTFSKCYRRLVSKFNVGLKTLLHQGLPAPIAQLVECPLRGTGGHGFDPGPRQPIKNSTSCSSLGTDLRGRSRTGRPSVRIMWMSGVSCQVSGTWYFSEAAL